MARIVIDSQNPWPGLEAFDEAASQFFNGRQNESGELRGLVLHTPLTLLFGASGVGKTSLIQAGLFPLLRRDNFLPIYARLDISDCSEPLIHQVNLELQTQIQILKINAPTFKDNESLWQYLHRRALKIQDQLGRLLTPIIVLDQFEEVLTSNTEESNALLIDLADLVENRMPASLMQQIQEDEEVAANFSLDRQRYRFLLSLREDFLPLIEDWKHDLPSIMRNRLRLMPMRKDQAFAAVRNTAPHLVDEDTAHRIVSFVAAEEDETRNLLVDSSTKNMVEPTLLSVLCRGLNERRKAQNKQTLDGEVLGRSGRSILLNYYDNAVRDLPDSVRLFIENELITKGGFRGSCDLDHAIKVYGVNKKQMELLVDRRLLHIEPHHGRDRVELTHERLTRVIRDRQLERTNRRRLTRISNYSTAIAVIVLALFTLLYRYVEQQKDTTISSRLGTAASLSRDRYLDLASLLALEAERRADTYDARNAKLSIFETSPELVAYLHNANLESTEIIAFSPNGKLFASAGSDGIIQLWDVASRQPFEAFLQRDSQPVNGVAFSSDSKLLASADDSGAIQMWDVASRQPLGELFRLGVRALKSVAFSSDGKLLAAVDSGGSIWLWDVTRKQAVRMPIEGHSGDVNNVTFSPNGELLASAGSSGSIWLSDLTHKQAARMLIESRPGKVDSVTFSPDGKLLASAGSSGSIWLWDLARKQAVGTQLESHSGEVNSLAFNQNGTRLASGASDGTIQIWDVRRRRALAQPLSGHIGPVTGITFSPDGKLLASTGCDSTIRLWQEPIGDDGKPLNNYTASVASVAVSPDAKLLASSGEDGAISLWDVANQRSVGEPLKGHVGKVTGLAFSADGKLLASGTYDGVIQLWDVTGHHSAGEVLHGHNGKITSVAFSASGKLLASGSYDGTVRLWDVKDHRSVGEALRGDSSRVTSVAFSSDGRLLAYASSERGIWLWDLMARQPVGPPLYGHTDSVNSVAFSPDGKQLASAGSDETVWLWDLTTPQHVGAPLQGRISSGHTDSINSVTFSPDGAMLASGGKDKAVWLWDVKTRQPFDVPLKGHSAVVKSVAFTPDGKMLASVTEDGRVRLWDVDHNSWDARLCRVANRNLSLLEWRQYMGPDVSYRPTCKEYPASEAPVSNGIHKKSSERFRRWCEQAMSVETR